MATTNSLVSAAKSLASKIVTTSNNTNNSKNTTTSTPKAWAGSTVSVSTPSTPSLNTTSNSGYVSAKNNWNWTTTYTKANWDSWTENSKWQVVSKVVNWAGMSVATNSTNSSNNSNTGGSSGSTSSSYVSSKKNNDWTTTYTKANWDSWTENSKWQVVSKVVNWAGMSVAPTTSSTSKTTSVSSSSGVWNPIKTTGSAVTNFINNVWTYKTVSPTTWSKAVATNADWSIKYADGSTYNPATGVSTKPTTTSSSSTKTVASNWLKSWDYTKNNANWSPAVQQMADWSIRYADGSTYNPSTGKTTAAKTNSSSFWNNVTSILSNSTVASNWLKSWDYTKNNANWSPAVQQMADWSIRYADGSIYNPKTWQTTDKNWNIVKDQSQATQVTEDIARWEANKRSNNSSPSNSSTYNPASNKTATTNRANQSALSVVLWSQKNWDGQGNIVWLQSKSLDTGENRNIASQERWLSDNGDGTQTYIAPNGKQYLIGTDENWNLAFISQWGKTAWEVSNIQDGNWNVINDMNSLIDYIRSNNQTDGINRTNVDNKYAVRDAEIVGTYNAPSGKEYDILTNDKGQVWFVNIRWEAQWFDTQDAALNYIDRNNPVWSTDTSKNTIKPEWENRVSDSIQDMNERMEEREESDKIDLEALKEEWREEWERDNDEADDTYYAKQQIVNQMFDDIDTFDRDINDAIDDLKQKSELLNDNERMRRARQRAAQLAAQWYLTSEQVAQVANYSLSDYNKELEANALEAAKAIAELRVNIAQKKQDYLNAIRTQQFANENDRQNQLNFASERFDKMLQYIDSQERQLSQFYWNTYNSNLAMNAQNELGYESIIKQNQAQNMVDDQNMLRALSNDAYRRQYILSQISDVNLHPYAEQLMNRLQNQGKFLIRDGGIEKQKSDLAKQISAIVDAARQQQLLDQQALAKL